ncbi:hypothetical protein VTN77DRAFT_8161 [Rasamsonia byssochlamydoides]|uniref:uncharacterized protein n=1 Tax=Rasamsonia byssochlamydoides TaxID=89139 RepID=UPI003742AF6A
MSEPIPESIPTSADPRSKRPLKRRALTPVSEQATQIQNLFKDPTKEIRIPEPSKPKTAASLPPPPEIVANVQGSSAGAGSGEFHVYKASRRREYERLRLMEEEVKREKADAEFEQRRAEAKRKDEEKTEKNRKKRERRRANKNKKANAAGNNNNNNNGGDDEMKVDNEDEIGPQETARPGPAAKPEEDSKSSAVDNVPESHEEPGVIIHEED